MGVRFIAGRAGSGKTLHCFNQIVEMLRADPLGPPIFWIVPKQETFITERDLTCGSGLKGFCRARVVSFEQLGEEVLAECGGTAIKQITPLGRQMIVGHILRKHRVELQYYSSISPRQGLAAEMDATFAELEHAGRSAEHLAALITTLKHESKDESLTLKLGDLHLIYEKYVAYLGQERLDPHRRLEQVLAAIEQCKRIRGATVFVDGFLELYDWQRKMLVSLGRACRDVQITALLDPDSPLLRDPHPLPDELSLFYKTEDAYRRLWFTFSEAGIEPVKPMRLHEPERFLSPSLKQIEKHIFADRPVICQAVQDVELIEAPDRRAEVDGAARQIQKYLAKGLRLRDIVVLTRDLNEYQDLIDASFIEHNIPWFADRRRTAAHHPLLQFARALLEIALHNWRHESVMTLIKSGLAGVSAEDGDGLENYVLLHRIQGDGWSDPQPWKYDRRVLTTHEDEQFVAQTPECAKNDAVRRHVAGRIGPLVVLLIEKGLKSVDQIVAELLKTLERFEVRKTLRRWMEECAASGRLEEREEHEQVWTKFVELLDELVEVLGNQEITPEDFVAALDTGLEQFDLALIPPTLDQVLVGSVERTRSARPRAVILLGMNDSQFPRAPSQGRVLSDTERRTLHKHNLDLEPDTQRGLLDEYLLGYIALTRASEYLCLTRPMVDGEQHPQSPSPFWSRLRKQFPTLQPVQIPRDSRMRVDLIDTPRQLVTSLMNWAKTDGKAHSTPWSALYQWLATYDRFGDPIDTMRSRAWRALSYSNSAHLSPHTVSQMLGKSLLASVSRVETFAACPFRHFARYGLNLTQREDPDVTEFDLGNVYHNILEQLVRQIIQKSSWDASNDALIKNVAEKVGHELRGELMLDSARNQYILRHVEKSVARIMRSQKAAAKRGKFIPWKTELRFGPGKEIGALVLKTSQENTLTLQGRIDRVDRVANEAAIAVIDYKLNENSLRLDWVYHGLSLQLLTYLIVLNRVGKLTPAAAFYVRLLRQLEKVAHPDDATSPDDPLFDLLVKPRGVINLDYASILDAQLGTKASEVVNVYVKTDGTLGKKNQSDAVEQDEFAAMLKVVESKLGELTDQILSGRIDVNPYRIATSTPCTYCEFRSLCRFDPSVNKYRHLPPMQREEVLKRALEQSR